MVREARMQYIPCYILVRLINNLINLIKMKLTETLKRRIDAFFRNLTEQEMEYLTEKYFNKHEKAINYTRCCKRNREQLKGKWDITFEQWIELYYTPYNATYMINKHGTLKTKKELRKYFDELKQNL